MDDHWSRLQDLFNVLGTILLKNVTHRKFFGLFSVASCHAFSRLLFSFIVRNFQIFIIHQRSPKPIRACRLSGWNLHELWSKIRTLELPSALPCQSYISPFWAMAIFEKAADFMLARGLLNLYWSTPQPLSYLLNELYPLSNNIYTLVYTADWPSSAIRLQGEFTSALVFIKLIRYGLRVWLYRSFIPVERGGAYFTCTKEERLPAFATPRGRVGMGAQITELTRRPSELVQYFLL
jgi:hypothetical protein